MRSPADAALSRGIQASVVAYVVWGLLTLYWKELADFRPFELIGWRIICASIVMLAVLARGGGLGRLAGALRDPSTRWPLVLASVLLTVNWTSYVWAVANDRVLETALGYFLAPLGTMLLGVTVLRERPSPAERLAIACAAIAVVVLTASYGRPPWAALAIAVSWSCYGLAKRRTDLSATQSFAGETLVMAPLALVIVVAGWGASASVPSTATAGEWLLVAGTGIVTAVPLLLFGVAARHVPFTILGALQYIVPTINFLLGWLVYDETLPFIRVVGFAFIWIALAAVTVGQLDRLRASRTRVGVLSEVS